MAASNFFQSKLAMLALPSNKLRKETKLAELQNIHRLGIHIWEEIQYSALPPLLEKPWAKINARKIPELLSSGEMPLLSLSLLPSLTSGKSVETYGFAVETYLKAGYLFALNQDASTPAKVLRAHTATLGSGAHLLEKSLRLDRETNIAELDNFYKNVNTKELSEIIAHERKGEFTEFQLNALGKYYETNNPPTKNDACHMNEIIVAAAKKHICAIVVPIGTYKGKPNQGIIKTNIYLQSMELAGALSGLMHLEKGLDLPVVLYNVTQANQLEGDEFKQGHCVYVGQGKKELTEKMLKSLKFLDLHRDDVIASNQTFGIRYLLNELNKHTGINLTEPLCEQQVALAELTKGSGLARGRV